jgi:hypothetical protein
MQRLQVRLVRQAIARKASTWMKLVGKHTALHSGIAVHNLA